MKHQWVCQRNSHRYNSRDRETNVEDRRGSKRDFLRQFSGFGSLFSLRNRWVYVYFHNDRFQKRRRPFLSKLDLVCFCCKSVFLVCSVAEGHEGGSAAPAPGLNNLPIDDDQV